MYSSNCYANNHHVTQGDSNTSTLGSDDKLSSVVSTCANLINPPISTSVSSILCQLPQYLRDGYTCSNYVEEVSGDFSLQEHAIKCGYHLTEDFLSIMNEHKVSFIDKVDYILSDLPNIFSSFLSGLKDHYKNITELTDKINSFFYKDVNTLRPKCIDVLQSEIIPIIISSILNSKVINGVSEREMTHTEMEQLFLRFVSSLEKLIMTKIMNYWQDFCKKEEYLLSLIPDVDCGDQAACIYNFDDISSTNITFPAAFTSKFGEHISFIAVAKIENVVNNFIGKCNDELKEIINHKCYHIFNFSDSVDNDIKELREKFNVSIEEEFNKKIMEEGIKDRFSSLLDNIVIWNIREGVAVNRSLIYDNIIEHMRDCLVNMATSNVDDAISCFKDKASLHEKRSLIDGKYLPIVENRWGVKLHPEDDKLIFIIVRNFSINIKDYLTKLFSKMLESGGILPNGMVICNCSWVNISEGLLPFAIKSSASIIEEYYKELDKVLSKARIVDVSKNDHSACVVRKITDVEKVDLVMRARKFVDDKLRFNARVSWSSVVSKSSKDTECDYKCKGIHGSDKRGSWGVKLCYRDDIIILNTRKEFSSRIKRVVCDKFGVMLNDKCKIDEVFIGSLPWAEVSKKLYSIAKNEIKPILEEEREELEKIVYKARAVVNSEVDRELTEKEKSMTLEQLMSRVEKMLRFSFRVAWEKATNDFRAREDSVATTSSDVGCLNEVPTSPTYETDAVDKDGVLMVKLSREDELAISNIRRQFSSEFYSFIGNKFSEMISKKYKLDDDTVVGVCSWKSISKKLFPIVRKEIDPILERERVKINEILLKSRVDVSPAASVDIITRELTPEERSNLLETIMLSVSKKVETNFSVIWAKTVELVPTISLTDLKEEYRFELDNIRIEFFGNLSSIVNDIIHSLPVDIYESPTKLENIKSYFSSVVSKRGHDLFAANGFLSRTESLLSNVQTADSHGNYRLVTVKEKEYIFKDFMDIIADDRDCLVRKRIVSKLNSITTTGGSCLPDAQNENSTVVTMDILDKEHSYAKKPCH